MVCRISRACELGVFMFWMELACLTALVRGWTSSPNVSCEMMVLLLFSGLASSESGP